MLKKQLVNKQGRENNKRLSFTQILNSRKNTHNLLSSEVSRVQETQSYPSLAQMLEDFEEFPDEQYILRFNNYPSNNRNYDEFEQSFEFRENPLDKWISSQSRISNNIKNTNKHKNFTTSISNRYIQQNESSQKDEYKIRFQQENLKKPQRLMQISQQYVAKKQNRMSLLNKPKYSKVNDLYYQNQSSMVSSISSNDFKSSLTGGQSSLYRYRDAQDRSNKRQSNKMVELKNYLGNTKIIQSQAYNQNYTLEQNNDKPINQTKKRNILVNIKHKSNKHKNNLGKSQQICSYNFNLQASESQSPNHQYFQSKQAQVRAMDMNGQNSSKQMTKQISVNSKESHKNRQEYEIASKNKQTLNNQNGVGYSFAHNIKNSINNQNDQMADTVVITKKQKQLEGQKRKLDELAFIAITKSEQENNYTSQNQKLCIRQSSFQNQIDDRQEQFSSELLMNQSDFIPLNSDCQKQNNIIQPKLEDDNKIQECIISQQVNLPQQQVKQKQINEVKTNEKNCLEYVVANNSVSYDVDYCSYPQSNLDSNFQDSKPDTQINPILQIQSNLQNKSLKIIDHPLLPQLEINDQQIMSQKVQKSQKIVNIFVGMQQKSQNQLQKAEKSEKSECFQQIEQKFNGQVKIQELYNDQSDKAATIRKNSKTESQSISALQTLQFLKTRTEAESQYKQESALSSNQIQENLQTNLSAQKQNIGKLQRFVSLPQQVLVKSCKDIEINQTEKGNQEISQEIKESNHQNQTGLEKKNNKCENQQENQLFEKNCDNASESMNLNPDQQEINKEQQLQKSLCQDKVIVVQENVSHTQQLEQQINTKAQEQIIVQQSIPQTQVSCKQEENLVYSKLKINLYPNSFEAVNIINQENKEEEQKVAQIKKIQQERIQNTQNVNEKHLQNNQQILKSSEYEQLSHNINTIVTNNALESKKEAVIEKQKFNNLQISLKQTYIQLQAIQSKDKTQENQEQFQFDIDF